MRTLYYSPGSPFARKIRIVLAEKGLDCELVEATLGSIDAMGAITPTLSVPCLVDGDVRLYESNLILEYLLATYPDSKGEAPAPPLSPSMTRPDHHWEDASALSALESVGNAMVNLRQLSLNGVTPETAPYLKRHQARIANCLDWLEGRATPEGFIPGQFSLMDINLICALAFSEARGNIFPWRGHANLEAVMARHAERPSVKSTHPPPFTPDPPR